MPSKSLGPQRLTLAEVMRANAGRLCKREGRIHLEVRITREVPSQDCPDCLREFSLRPLDEDEA